MELFENHQKRLEIKCLLSWATGLYHLHPYCGKIAVFSQTTIVDEVIKTVGWSQIKLFMLSKYCLAR